jgi:hypothetical protein
MDTTRVSPLQGKEPGWPHPEFMTRLERLELRLEERKTKRNEREARTFLLRLLSYFACGVFGAGIGAATIAVQSHTDLSVMLFAFPLTAMLAGIVVAYLLAIWWMSPEEEEVPMQKNVLTKEPAKPADA